MGVIIANLHCIKSARLMGSTKLYVSVFFPEISGLSGKSCQIKNGIYGRTFFILQCGDGNISIFINIKNLTLRENIFCWEQRKNFLVIFGLFELSSILDFFFVCLFE